MIEQSILLKVITGMFIALSSNEHGIDPKLLHSIVTVETNYRNVRVRDLNGHGSYGVAQVQLALCQAFDSHCTVDKLMNVGYNIHIASTYLKYLKSKCKKNMKCMISSYSTGHVKKYNSKYVSKVMKEYGKQKKKSNTRPISVYIRQLR